MNDLEHVTLEVFIAEHDYDYRVRPANKSQVEIQEIYAGRNKRTQSCHFASAIKDGGSP